MTARASTGNRGWLYLSILLLFVLAGSVSAISVLDPEGWAVRVGMVLATVGAAMFLPAPAVAVLVPLIWLGPTYVRLDSAEAAIRQPDTLAQKPEFLLELPGLVALALASLFTRRQLRECGKQDKDSATPDSLQEMEDPYPEALLEESLEQEVAHSRRFNHEFALMLAEIDAMRAKFDYRDDAKWAAGIQATAAILLKTRKNVDRVFLWGDRGFALLLPETGPQHMDGLVQRLRKDARKASPSEGEPGGPLPLHFGVTFFPRCATTAEELLRRAQVELRLAEESQSRVRLDGAEAPCLPSPEPLRKDEEPAEEWPGAMATHEDESRPDERPAPALMGTLDNPGWEAIVDARPATDGSDDDMLGTEMKGSSKVAGQSAPGESSRGQTGEDSPPKRPGIEPEIEEAVSGLLKHLDETLGLIRDLRTAGREES